MNIYFKRFLSLFIFLGLNFSILKPVDDVSKFTYQATSIATVPAALAVLYAHAKSNEKLETKLKLIEAIVQIVHESSYNKAYWQDTGYLDNAWLGFETFRAIKYLKKYLNDKKEKQDDKKEKQDVNEQAIQNSKDSPKKENNDIDESLVADLLNENKDEKKSKSLAFKIKVGVCLILLFFEVDLPIESSDYYGLGRSFVFRNSGLFCKGLRHFLLSESGSWEAKISIVFAILSCFKIPLTSYNERRQRIEGAENLFMFSGSFTEKELQDRYEKLLIPWRSDKNIGNKKEADEMFGKISRANEILQTYYFESTDL